MIHALKKIKISGGELPPLPLDTMYQHLQVIQLYLHATFTFDMDSNATPCEKLSEELQFDTNIIGLRRTLKCLDAEKLYRKDTLADI